MAEGLIGAEYDSDDDGIIQPAVLENVRLERSARKGTWYHRKDGFFYHVKEKRQLQNKIYLKCFKKHCPGTARTRMDLQGPLIPLCLHNHVPDIKALPTEFLKKDLLDASENKLPSTSHQKTYKIIAKKYHSKIIGRLPYVSCVKAMQNRSRKKNPKIPETIPELHAKILESNYRKTLDGPNFITAANEENLLLISPKTAELFNEDVIFCCDGTFKCTPRKPKIFQLFVIGGILNKGFIPIAYVLMKNKNKQSYIWVLNQIRGFYPGWQPTHFISDYETGSMAAIHEIFENCHQQGCWFHFSQAIEKKAKSFGLTQLIRENELAKKIVQRFMVLPLLPEHFIRIGWELTKHKIVNNFPQQEQENLKKLADYVENFWLERIGEQKMSVSDSLHRTNNLQEAFNGHIMLLMGDTRTGSHPNIWSFMDALKTYEHDSAGKYRAAKNNLNINFPKPSKWRQQDANIQQAQNELADVNGIGIDDFLERVAHYRNFHIINGVDVNDEDLDDPAPIDVDQ